MKKIYLNFLIFFLLFSGATHASSIDTSSWYLYNGYSTEHNFSVSFPKDWKTSILSDEIQAFSPQKNKNFALKIEEFEGKSLSHVIDSYKDEQTTVLKSEDFIFSTKKEDLIAKKIIYSKNNTDFEKILIKRGTLILVLSEEDKALTNINQSIIFSLNFNDKWHEYLDFTDNYIFIIPTGLKLFSDNQSVQIKNDKEEIIFQITKYKNSTLEKTIKEQSAKLLNQREFNFHDLKGTLAEYKNSEGEFALFLYQKNNDVFTLTWENIEENYPLSTYYNDLVSEILESFEFFDIEGEYTPFKHFSDIRDNNINEKAVNYLAEKKIINGYSDGTFKPDGEINRAELTKMIVALKLSPDPKIYANCFYDVKTQWYAPYICYAKEKKWVSGYKNGKFYPEKKINRAEALKILIEVLFEGNFKYEDNKSTKYKDINEKAWYNKYFNFANNHNLLDKQHVKEEKYFINNNITRKEVAEIIYNGINMSKTIK